MVYSALTPVVSDFPQRAQNQMYDQLSWAIGQFQNNNAFIDPILKAMGDSQTGLNNWATQDRARYENVYQPLQDKIISDASNWDSPDRVAQARGRATAGAAQAADAANAAADRDLERIGVDPSMTRFAGINRQARLNRATSEVGASENAETTLHGQGIGLRMAANQMGQGLPGQATAENVAGTQTGATAAGIKNQTAATFMPALGNPIGWGGLTVAGNNAYTGATSATNQATQAQEQIDANKSGGFGSLLGLAGGAGLSALSSPSGSVLNNLLTKIPLFAAAAHGGEIPPDPRGASPRARATEGFLDPSMSPSGGAQTDDIPAAGSGGNLKVDAGEFVFPRRTVSYFGTKYLEGLIKKADDAMGVGEQPIGPEYDDGSATAAGGGAIPGVPHQSSIMPRINYAMKRMNLHSKMPRISATGSFR